MRKNMQNKGEKIGKNKAKEGGESYTGKVTAK